MLQMLINRQAQAYLGMVIEGEIELMLGSLFYEGRGKVIGTSVLPNGKLEQTVGMQGLVEGEEFSATWTGETEIRPDGTGHVEFHGFYSTKSGAVGRYTGIGNGIHGSDGSASYRGTACYSSPPGKYARLNGIAVVFETEHDRDGNVLNKGWEWK
jgi:hypothetical protein